MISAGVLTLAVAGSGQAQTTASVSIELLADGRCAVSAQGSGFRSNATYKPQTSQDSHELRCAMPPVPKDRTIELTVTLPSDAQRPSASVPSLQWSRVSDRWTGTGELSEWPDTVTIATSGRLQTLLAPGAGLVAVLTGLVWRRRRKSRRTPASSEATSQDR